MNDETKNRLELAAEPFYLESGGPQIRRVHALQLEMLLALNAVARRHGRPAMLIFGSLLGAARHGAFIPWDDDIDVGVLRADYEPLLDALRAELDPARFIVEDAAVDHGVARPYAKIRCRHSLFVEAGLPQPEGGEEALRALTASGRMGVFLDIFPLDNVPQGRIGQRWQRLRYMLDHFPRRVALEGYRSERGWLQSLYARRARRAPAELWRRLEATMTRYGRPDSRLVIAFPAARSDLDSSYLERSGLLPAADMDFNGHPVQVPRDWQQQLVWLFGDWRQLPPESARHGHRLSACYIDEAAWAEVLAQRLAELERRQ